MNNIKQFIKQLIKPRGCIAVKRKKVSTFCDFQNRYFRWNLDIWLNRDLPLTWCSQRKYKWLASLSGSRSPPNPKTEWTFQIFELRDPPIALNVASVDNIRQPEMPLFNIDFGDFPKRLLRFPLCNDTLIAHKMNDL